jgi:hypothetical protein
MKVSKIIASIVGILILAVAVWWIKDKPVALNASPTPTVTPGPDENLGTPSGKDIQSLTPEEIERLVNGKLIQPNVSYAKLTKPATCSIGGTVKFVSPSIYQNINNNFKYTGIDSPARQVKWKITPEDDLRIGPNLTAQFTLPDGTTPIGVTLPAQPKAKSYTLTASITYGRQVGDDIKISEAACTGKTTVELAY